MKSDGNWYVRNTSGKVFGPIAFKTLQEWVRDGRVEPLAGISEDLQNWMLAPLKPELEMDWIVENNPGQFYGPTHKSVIDDFIGSGTLSPGARFYCDDRGRTLEALKVSEIELEKAKKELESVKAAKAAEALKAGNAIKGFKAAETKLKAELDGLRTELEKSNGEADGLRAELEKANGEADGLRVELEKANGEADGLRAELEKANAELEAIKAEKDKVHAREWKTEVLVPEVVINDEPPPSTARTVFGNGLASTAKTAFDNNQFSLAELERQAQTELARMGASGVKKLFRFGKKK